MPPAGGTVVPLVSTPTYGGSILQRVGKAAEAFASSFFSPTVPSAPAEDTQREGARNYNYATGYNTNITPRGAEGLTPFKTLENLALMYDMAAMCIRYRIDEITGMNWSVVDTDPQHPASAMEKEDYRAFLAKPDGITEFEDWLAALTEETLVTDALSIYMPKNRRGEIIGFELVDGSTIRCLTDAHGRVPQWPAPSHQQVVWGRIFWEADSRNFLYRPRIRRTRSLYGRSPTEELIITINRVLRRQTFDLSYYSQGNIPELLIPVGDLPAKQIEDLQAWFDGITSTDNQRRKAHLIPSSVGRLVPFEFKKPIMDPTVELFLDKRCMTAYGVTAGALGFQEETKGAGATQENVLYGRRESAIKWTSRTVHALMQSRGTLVKAQPTWNCRIQFAAEEPEEDKLRQAQVDKTYVSIGKVTVDELRKRDGQPALGINRPFIVTPAGPVYLDTALERAEQPPAIASDGTQLPPGTTPEQVKQVEASKEQAKAEAAAQLSDQREHELALKGSGGAPDGQAPKPSNKDSDTVVRGAPLLTRRAPVLVSNSEGKNVPLPGEVVDKIDAVTALLPDVQAKGATLVGSFANGDSKASSDIDILVHADPTYASSVFKALEDRLNAEGGRPVEITVGPYLKTDMEGWTPAYVTLSGLTELVDAADVAGTNEPGAYVLTSTELKRYRTWSRKPRARAFGFESALGVQVMRAADDSTVREHRDAHTNSYASALAALALALRNGAITPADYQKRAAALWAKSVGTLEEHYGSAESEWAGPLLDGFRDSAELGSAALGERARTTNDNLQAGATAVAGAMWAASHVLEATSKEPDITGVWDCVNDDASCDHCIELDGQSWTIDEIPEWPGDGNQTCLGNCRCGINFDASVERTDFFTDEDGTVHPIAGSDGYDPVKGGTKGGGKSTKDKGTTAGKHPAGDIGKRVSDEIAQSGGLSETSVRAVGQIVRNEIDSRVSSAAAEITKGAAEIEAQRAVASAAGDRFSEKVHEVARLDREAQETAKGTPERDAATARAEIAAREITALQERATAEVTRLVELDAAQNARVQGFDDHYREKTLEVLSEIRPLGHDGADTKHEYAKGSSKEMIGHIEAAMANYPSDWLRLSADALRQASLVGKPGDLLVSKLSRGYYAERQVRSNGAYGPRIALSPQGGTIRTDAKGNPDPNGQRYMPDPRGYKEVAAHELGHRMEDAIPRLAEVERQFYERRTAGERLTHIRGDKPNAVTLKDQFTDEYMGRNYEAQGYRAGKYYEVFSMGAERVIGGRDRGLRDKDPEYHHFILGALATLGRKP